MSENQIPRLTLRGELQIEIARDALGLTGAQPELHDLFGLLLRLPINNGVEGEDITFNLELCGDYGTDVRNDLNVSLEQILSDETTEGARLITAAALQEHLQPPAGSL